MDISIPPPPAAAAATPTTTTATILASNTNTNNNNNNTPCTKQPDPDSETPNTKIQTPKPLSFSNGVLKRHHHHHHIPVVVIYKECLKNHAASLGGHAVDGCGEFMPPPASTYTDPTSLKCAACGCHRNFHRRENDDHHHHHHHTPPALPPPPPPSTATATATIEYQPHHRHHPPPPPQPPHHHHHHHHSTRSPNSASPPPISSSYFPSAPHMLLALSGAGLHDTTNLNSTTGSSPRKRFRTKFTQSQKDRMLEFAERVGWKMQRKDEEMVREFCNEIKVDKGVLKVWMHNNKNTFGKRDGNNGNVVIRSTSGVNVNASGTNSSEDQNQNHHHYENVQHVGSNGSSSSS